MFFFPLTATIVRISDAPSETMAPTAAYSAQKELGCGAAHLDVHALKDSLVLGLEYGCDGGPFGPPFPSEL